MLRSSGLIGGEPTHLSQMSKRKPQSSKDRYPFVTFKFARRIIPPISPTSISEDSASPIALILDSFDQRTVSQTQFQIFKHPRRDASRRETRHRSPPKKERASALAPRCARRREIGRARTASRRRSEIRAIPDPPSHEKRYLPAINSNKSAIPRSVARLAAVISARNVPGL